ncbi:MAG TPA: apolipoprotein N-acyltransferase [Longimicrobiales bacterium]|nr:apolipoprotein N-acyltransferase [Longimicrobiales bacterium]
MTLAPPRGERALPVLAGALLALAFAPAAFLLPSFVALAPLLVFIAERPAGAAGRWSATRGALATGAVFYGLRLTWILVALGDRSALAVPAYLLTVLLLAATLGLFGWAVHHVRQHLTIPLPLLAAVLWTGLEWAHAAAGPLAFPWLALGTSLAPFPRLAGAADLAGVRGLSFWLAAVNGAVAVLVLRARAGRPCRLAPAGTLALVLVPVVYGVARAASLELRTAALVAVVQPNIPDDLRRDRTAALDSSLATLARLTAALPGRAIDLVVWPEVALPAALALDRSLVDSVAALSRRAAAPVLLGSYGLEPAGARLVAFNSAFLVGPRGLAGPRYDKRLLVPFIERVPFLPPAPMHRFVGGTLYYGALGAGAAAPVMRTGAGSRFGVLICYESAFGALARAYRRDRADFLVNITNDGWYGRDAWYGRTSALWQHPAHLVLRAIETRTGVARAASTGFSLFIDPLGRTYGRIPLFREGVAVEPVLTTSAVPLFVRWGDWLASLAALAAALMVLTAVWRARRSTVPHPRRRPPWRHSREVDPGNPRGYILRLARNRTRGCA